MRHDDFRRLLSRVLQDGGESYGDLSLVLLASTLSVVEASLEHQIQHELGLTIEGARLTPAQMHAVQATLLALLDDTADCPPGWLLSAMVYLYDDRAVVPVVRLLERRLLRAPGWEDVDAETLVVAYLSVFVHEQPHPLAVATFERLARCDDPELRRLVR